MRHTGMKHKLASLVALALLAGACGSEAGGPVSDHPEFVPIEAPAAGMSAASQPALRDASPEPMAEPVYKPVPEPSPPPPSKPIRPNPPTPPPPRQRPQGLASDPVRTPPALDVRPGEATPRQPGDVPQALPKPLPVTDPRVVAATENLADRLEPGAVIDVLDAREVTWRDGSVGCPSPDLAYTHALVPGFLVVLRSDDTSYRYHSAGDLMPFLCETPQAPLEGSA